MGLWRLFVREKWQTAVNVFNDQMKKTLLFCLSMTLVVVAYAVPRSAKQALELAERFVGAAQSVYGASPRTLSLSVSAETKLRNGVTGEVVPAYYICNVGEGDGFVVVSGDDRFKDVLGYSAKGNVTDGNMPDGLRYWLGFLASEMSSVLQAGTSAEVPQRCVVASVDCDMSKSVEPLVKTKWNQNTPYNTYCPVVDGKATVTGCVATGMAQVMKYHAWPVKGTGSHTNVYHPEYSADFGASEYDWGNMLDEYTDSASEQQKNAVATLMYHCGVATDMRYTHNDSATPSILAGQALVNHFGYNPFMHYEGRDYMTDEEWKQLLVSELQAGRPLMYWGMTAEESGLGHFFVCDGYDATSGKFHFNWGWSGVYDGYYEISALEPGVGGAGAGTGEFNYMQSVLVGLQPEPMGQYESHFEMKSFEPAKKTVNQGANMEFRITELTNNAINFTGKIGFAVYKDGKLFKTLSMSGSLTNLPLGAYYSEHTMSCKFNSEFAAGTYQVCLIAQNDGQENFDVIRAYRANTTVWNAEVTTDYRVKFTPATEQIPSGIGEVKTTKDVKSTDYYNLSGVRLPHPQRGVTVRRTVFTDGTVRVDKVMR